MKRFSGKFFIGSLSGTEPEILRFYLLIQEILVNNSFMLSDTLICQSSGRKIGLECFYPINDTTNIEQNNASVKQICMRLY